MRRIKTNQERKAEAAVRSSQNALRAAMASLQALEDPRRKRGLRYPLETVFVVTLLATICGCDDAEAVEQWGLDHARWLDTFLDMPHGPPTQDVVLSVFARLDPREVQEVFDRWLLFLKQRLGELGAHIAIDGKTSRGSRSKKKAATHIVSAWASEVSMVIAQTNVRSNSNEITAIPELLKMLDLEGTFVTIDAMGCQTKIVTTIAERGGQYLIAAGDNQKTLRKEVETTFADIDRGSDRPRDQAAPPSVLEYTETSGDHGRVEVRRTRMTTDHRHVRTATRWLGLNLLIQVVRIRECKATGEKTQQVAYYVSNAKTDDVELIHRMIRAHWGVENGLHWVLDVAFDEDRVRARTGNAAANLAVVRHMALNLLKRETTLKLGVANKRRRAAWNPSYLLQVMTGGPDRG